MTQPIVSRRNRGFTLIEVLAVCAIISLALAILAPAMQVARARAKTISCRNNLKQIGLAIHNYHDTFIKLPPGYIVATKIAKDESRDMAWNSGWGWQALALPFVDHAGLYNQLNFRAGLPTTVDKGATTKIPVFRCADDNGAAIVAKVNVLGPLPVDRATTVVAKGFARSNYVGVVGWDLDWHLGQENPNLPDKTASNWSQQDIGHDFRDGIAIYQAIQLKGKQPSPNARDHHGVFGENSSRGFRDLSDGVANTFVVGERATPTKNDAETDVGNAIWAGVPDRSTRAGQASSLGSAHWPINHEMTEAKVPNSTGFNSRHGAGANFMLGDGVVKTVSDKMDLSLLRRLSVIDDGVKAAFEIPLLP